MRLKFRKFCLYLVFVIDAERTAFSVSKVPSSRVNIFRFPRGMAVNGAMFLRCECTCGKAAVKPARVIVMKRVNADLFNMTLESKSDMITNEGQG